MTISKLLSTLLALAYIGVAQFAGGGGETLKRVGCLLLPMACIWFSDELGDYSGNLMLGGPMTCTPGFLVAAFGWLLLMLPLILGLIFGLGHAE